MRAIFISYRRDDSEGQTGRLFKDLVAQFGKDSVFMDVVGIEPGRDFRRVIDEQVASCGVLLAMMGRHWVDATDEAGHRRLDDPSDFVRLETATALKRDIPVIPVLVHGASMPRADQLPPDLSELAYRNGVELTHARWDSDVEVLIKALRPYVDAGPGVAAATPVPPAPQPPAGAQAAPKKPFSAGLGAALVALVVVIGGYVVYDGSVTRSAKEAEAQRDREMSQKAAAEVAAARAEADRARQEAEAAKDEAERLARDRIAAEKAARAKAELDAARAEADKAKRDAEAAREAARMAQAERDKAERPPVPATGGEAAAGKTAKYRGKFTAVDPCTGRTVTVTGTTFVEIRPLASGVGVMMQFDGAGDGYTVSYRGRKRFDQPAASYDLAILGRWSSEGGSQFVSEGVDRVSSDPGGRPTGDRVQRLDNTCKR